MSHVFTDTLCIAEISDSKVGAQLASPFAQLVVKASRHLLFLL
jgi:hypothetical protein